MIGWYVDVGYLIRPTWDGKRLTNLNEITFTDFNRPFLFYNVTKYTDWNGSGNEDLRIAAEDVFGSEVNALWAGYSTNYYANNSKYNFREFFPGIENGYPNLYAAVHGLPAGTSVLVVYKFNSLNKLLITNGNPSYYVYGIGAGGALTGISQYRTGSCSSSDRDMYIFYLTESYYQTKDLTDPNSFGAVSLDGVGTYSSNNTSLTFRSNSSAGLPYLFDKDSVPDIDRDPGGEGPYAPGGESGEGDLPPGTFDDSSDPIPDSSLPSISAADTGFTRIYNPTLAQVQSLAKYLWTDDTVLDTIWNHIKQFFEDPMQAIIGFNLVPCRVPDGGTRNFSLMYIDTGVQMTAAASQFVDVDCGTLKLERYYGSALDQNPYTKISCYLPYIGTVHLDTDEVMGTTLQVKYRIDIVSGSCVAKILVDGNVLYQYSGHCAITVPISSADFASYVSAAVSVGAVAAGLAAGAAAGIGVGAAESEALTVTSAEMSAPITASEASALIGGESATGVATGATFNGINAANITNTVGQVMGSKLQIEHAGSFSGNSGYLGVRRPYIIINRPNMCLPSIYGHLNGYPSMITLNLGECSGFTKVQQVQLTGVTATNPEQSEILQFLKSGVYL